MRAGREREIQRRRREKRTRIAREVKKLARGARARVLQRQQQASLLHAWRQARKQERRVRGTWEKCWCCSLVLTWKASR